MRPLTTRSRMAAVALAVAALLGPAVARADAISADAARAALARGATAWDVRSGAHSVIGGAVRVAPADVGRWLDGQGSHWLERAVSAAGIDLSRDVVVYGAAGDPRAQALHDGLTRLTSGRVYWLVGGIDEWRAAGLPTAAGPTQRLPVPQRLVLRAAGDGTSSAEMAAAGLRSGATAPPATTVATTGPGG